MSEYVFKNHEKENEKQRLEYLTRACDPLTIQKLTSLNIENNWHCLEVGAGLGTIAQWLSKTVYRGQVHANDVNTEHISSLNISNMKLLKGDITRIPLEENQFDLIHARYVLIHIKDSHELIQKLYQSLKPGGYIILEEPDFSYESNIISSGNEVMDKVNRAITIMYQNMGLNIDIAQNLAPLVSNSNFKNIESFADIHYQNGTSDMAVMMKSSCEFLKEKYLETGLVGENDIHHYLQVCDNPDIWTHYYTTFSVIAQK